jgi:hypothetical protein
MRRRSLAYAALFLSVIGTACADNKPTGPLVEPSAYAPLANLSLGDYIQEEIYLILPKGFENVVDARWATVRNKKNAGDMVGAAAHLATLVDWMDKKTSEATPPFGETKEQAVARLVLNMMEWLYGSETAPPHEPLASEDVVVQVIPAGQSGTVVVPSDHAGFDIGPQPQTEIVVISQESEDLYPGQCNGPLPTPRCQVPLFYKYDIQPNTGFVKNSARFAVCMIGGSSAERRPLDYLEDEARFENPEDRPVHHRMTMAHEAPADPTNDVQGGHVEGNVEFLPLAPVQKGFVHCDAPSQLGMSRTERALYAVMQFVGRIVSPKDVYAYDAGAEHIADAASHFNGADPYSGPDLSVASFTATPHERFAGEDIAVAYSVENRSRRNGGHSTAKSQSTTASVSIYSNAALTTLAAGPFAATTIDPMVPDAQAQLRTPTVTLPGTLAPGTYWIAVKVVPNSGDPNFGGITEVDAPSYANNVSSSEITVVSPEVPIALNLSSVEKLPNGTQHFFVASGSPGPYIWSVKGVDGGNATFGTIATNTEDFSGDYTAPAAVPTPATFDVCARRETSPTNKACASVTIKPVPTSGADVIVFNDLNVFDNTFGAPDPNNLQLFRNLVTYTGTGPRATKTRVWVHRGHNVRCDQPVGTEFRNTECSSSGWSTFESTMRAAGSGFTVDDVDDASAPLTTIASDVKVIILALPMTSYSSAEINSLKSFAGDGGRIIFVGEWDAFYGVGLTVENDFLSAMGAVMRNTGGAIDCGRNVLPASSLRPHQVTAGLEQLTIACASVVAPGTNDYALFYDKAGTSVLGAVAKVDVTPLSALVSGASLRALTQSSTTTALTQSSTTTSIAQEQVYSWGIGSTPPAALRKP